MKNIGILFVFAFLLRLIHLDQSLWLDEATTAVTVRTLSGWDIVTKFSPGDFHPPLYYLLMDLWTLIFGYSEIALRMPSVIASLITGIFVYQSTKTILKNHSHVEVGASFATLFFLLNPLIVYYSQEARMYALSTCFISISFYFLLQKKQVISTIFGLFAFYTFYGSLFYLLSMWFYYLLRRDWKSALMSMFVFTMGFAPLVLLLYPQLLNSQTALGEVANWSSVLGPLSLKNLILIPIKFVSGRISFEPKLLYFLMSGVSALCVFVVAGLPLVRKKDWHSSSFAMLWFFFGAPLLFGVLASLFTPLLQFFRFQFVILFLSMILGVCVILSPKSRIGGSIVVMIFLSWSLLYLLIPSFHREDWKSLSKNLESNLLPIFMIGSSSDPLKYYVPNKEIRSLKYMHIKTDEKALYVIPYTADIHGVDYQKGLASHGFVKSEKNHVRGIPFELWKRD